MGSSYASSRLGKIAKVRSGYAFKSRDMGSVGVPIVKIRNIKPPRVDVVDCQRIPSQVIEDVPNSSRYKLAEGDVLIAMTGATVGKVGRMPTALETHFLNQRVGKVFLIDDSAADYDYLYYVLSQEQQVRHMFGVADGSAQANISGAQIEQLEIPLPQLPVQRTIAHILGTLDDKIELNRRMNRTLEAIARAIFKSWFIDFDPVIDNALLNGKPIPDEFDERAEVRRAILARSQPSPQAPLPEVEGRNYRGGFDFSGLVEKARELRKNQTPAEEILWELLRDRRFLDLKFRRQHQIGDYIADFYCHEHKAVIELDGGIHRTKDAKDAKRDSYMQSLGLTVLRFPNDAILDSPDRVLDQVVEALDVSPSPSRRGGGEGAEDTSPSTLGRGARGEGVASYRHLFPDSFQDSPLGSIPKGWKVSTAGKEFCLTMGQSPPGSTYNEDSDGLPFFQGRRDFAFRFPTRRVFCSAPKRIAEAGDTLVSVRAPVGDVNMASERLCLGRGLAGVRHRSGSCSYTYYSMLSLRDRFREYESEGTVFGAINKSQFAGLEWITSPTGIVNAFECRVWATDERIRLNEAESAQLESVRDSLLPELLSGRQGVLRTHVSRHL